MNSEDLLEKARNGDKRAFRQLCEGIYDDVERFVGSQVENSDEKYEITAETFSHILEKFDTFKGQSKFTTWAFRIARNCCSDYFRKKKRETSFSELKLDAELLEDLETCDLETELIEQEAHSETAAEMGQCLNELTEEQREALMLRYVDELNTKEVALVMDKSEASIKNLVLRGTVKIKNYYGKIRDKKEGER